MTYILMIAAIFAAAVIIRTTVSLPSDIFFTANDRLHYMEKARRTAAVRIEDVADDAATRQDYDE